MALARNISERNDLDIRDLNFAVQAIINRLIFLRLCEDKGIEPYGRLLEIAKSKQIYKKLSQFFKQADKRYNAGLFHFYKERGRSTAPDKWTLSLQIDDKNLRRIIQSIYPPNTPYEFSVIPIEILGHVYEQFLGKVIVLDKKQQTLNGLGSPIDLFFQKAIGFDQQLDLQQFISKIKSITEI